MVGPTGFVKGALPGSVEHEMHDVSLHDADVGESDVGIRLEQHSERSGSTVVLRGTILIGAVERSEFIPVDERGGAGRRSREIGPEVLQKSLAHDDIDHGDPRNRGSPRDEASGDGGQQGACFLAPPESKSGQEREWSLPYGRVGHRQLSVRGANSRGGENSIFGSSLGQRPQNNPFRWPMTIDIRVNRDTHLEVAGTADERPRSRGFVYLTLKIAMIFRLAGSNTASRGCPRPVRGIAFG